MKTHMMKCNYTNPLRNQSISQRRVTSCFYVLQTKLDMGNGERFSKPSEETLDHGLIISFYHVANWISKEE
jgi:hypothetical protein